jgi:hypothetical protein
MRYFLASVGVTAVVLLAAGCGSGGGSPAAVATLGTTTTSTVASATPQNQQAEAVAYSRCMRANGVRAFPDPPTSSNSGRAFKDAINHLATSNPHFTGAQSNCAHLLPNGGTSSGPSPQQQRAQLADALAFARCMRRRGVSRFPDPSNGQLTVAMVAAQGINVNSPQILRVVQACLPATHGGLTPAKVREALNNYNNHAVGG